MTIRTRESDFEKRQFPRLKLAKKRWRMCGKSFFRAKNVAIIHIATRPALPEKLVEGMIQPVQIAIAASWFTWLPNVRKSDSRL